MMKKEDQHVKGRVTTETGSHAALETHRKVWRTVVAATSLVAMLVTNLLMLSACASDTGGAKTTTETPKTTTEAPAETTANDEELYLAAFSKGFQHVFWKRIEEGMQAACDEYGARLTYEAPEEGLSVDVQIEQIEAALGRAPNAILVAPIDSTAVAPIIEKADAEGIAIFSFNDDVDSDKVKAYYGTSNLEGGRLAAEKMAEILGGKGKVAIVNFDQVSGAGRGREDGFVNYMKENCPDIEIVDIQYNNDDALKSMEICSTFMLAHEDLAGIYATGQSCSEGLIQAIEDQDMVGKIAAVGFDSGKAVMDAVRSGVLNGAITQDPYNQGYMSAKAALEYLVNGIEPSEYDNDTGCHYYTADNIDSEDIQGMLYE